MKNKSRMNFWNEMKKKTKKLEIFWDDHDVFYDIMMIVY